MAQDNKIIAALSPADLVGLLRETAGITVLESAVADGKPVIQAAVQAVNTQTGEVLAGGLPFSIVMFKGPSEAGYSNVAIGTVVPAAELDIHLPRDYFNFCNQRLRFVRVFPLDAGSFVIQMDLILRGATREYIKFQFGLWGMLFKQVLFELIGSGRESLIHAAEVYAATDVAQHYVSTLPSQASEEGPGITEPSLGQGVEPVLETETTQILPPTHAEEAPLAEQPVEASILDEPVAEAAPEPPHEDPHQDAYEARSENVMMTADPAEGKDETEPHSLEPADSEAFAVTLLDAPVAENPAHSEIPAEEPEPLLSL